MVAISLATSSALLLSLLHAKDETAQHRRREDGGGESARESLSLDPIAREEGREDHACEEAEDREDLTGPGGCGSSLAGREEGLEDGGDEHEHQGLHRSEGEERRVEQSSPGRPEA
eukprot:747448-Hanusia_phi.AAC.1